MPARWLNDRDDGREVPARWLNNQDVAYLADEKPPPK